MSTKLEEHDRSTKIGRAEINSTETVISTAPSLLPDVKANKLLSDGGSEILRKLEVLDTLHRKLEELDTLHKFYKKMCILAFFMGLLGLGAIFGLCYLVVDLLKVSLFETSAINT